MYCNSQDTEVIIVILLLIHMYDLTSACMNLRNKYFLNLLNLLILY